MGVKATPIFVLGWLMTSGLAGSWQAVLRNHVLENRMFLSPSQLRWLVRADVIRHDIL